MGDACNFLYQQCKECDSRISRGEETLGEKAGKIRAGKALLRKLHEAAAGFGEPASPEQGECSELEERLERLQKDAEATKRRVLVHDRDQQKKIASLEAQVAAAKKEVADRSEYQTYKPCE